MDWFDNLIPTAWWNRGVSEFHDEFDGFPLFTTFLLFLLVVGMIMLAVSIDSMVIRKAGGAVSGAMAA